MVACIAFVITYGGRWSFAAHHNSAVDQRLSAAQLDRKAARKTLSDFRKKPQRETKAKVNVSDLMAAFQLSSNASEYLNKTLDTLPFLMDCGAADVWLDSRLAFHESEAIEFPEGSDPLALEVERDIEMQIRGLDIGLEKDCTEYPCMFTLHTETIPANLLRRFHDEIAMAYSTLIFERPTCEVCSEQFLSFGASEDPIPDAAFRRMRWRKQHGVSQ